MDRDRSEAGRDGAWIEGAGHERDDDADEAGVLPMVARALDWVDLEIPPGEGRVVVRIEAYREADLPIAMAAGDAALIALEGRPLVVRITRYDSSGAPRFGVTAP